MVLQGGSDINLRRPRNKKKRLVDNSNLRPWSELPEALVHLITKQLGAIDYLMFGCVCKGWRSYVVVHRQEFMASQPPLVVFLSTLAQKSCYFYSIFDQKTYKATLPNLIGKSCYSLTCGEIWICCESPPFNKVTTADTFPSNQITTADSKQGVGTIVGRLPCKKVAEMAATRIHVPSKLSFFLWLKLCPSHESAVAPFPRLLCRKALATVVGTRCESAVPRKG
uniref:F-box domain-containing protein n=1 Tax=Fagus sylvatica TaxID=28930 RepID=A0A2N9IP20_FAGSY